MLRKVALALVLIVTPAVAQVQPQLWPSYMHVPQTVDTAIRIDNGQRCTAPAGTVQGSRFIVGHDPGGCARTYHTAIRAYRARGISPVITGNAASAATLWTADERACATPTAALTFHGLAARRGWTPAYREEL